MKHHRLIAAALLAAGLLACAGCTASDHLETRGGVALTTLGPVEHPVPSARVGFHLGAGDNLGQDVFENYVNLMQAGR